MYSMITLKSIPKFLAFFTQQSLFYVRLLLVVDLQHNVAKMYTSHCMFVSRAQTRSEMI